MDEVAFNMSVRKFLKKVGVTSQREIEAAVRAAEAAGTLSAGGGLKAEVTLKVGGLGLAVTIDGDIELV
jgi:hypothetical protein